MPVRPTRLNHIIATCAAALRPSRRLVAAVVLLCGCGFDPSGYGATGDQPPSNCDVAPSPDCENDSGPDATPDPAPDAGPSTPVPPTPPLLAHWKFDGDSRDALGRFDAEEMGDVRYVAGPDGLALDLSDTPGGRDDTDKGPHVRVASDAPNGTTPGTLSPDSFTVALWMKADGEEREGQVFERGRPCLASYSLMLESTTLTAGVNAGTTWCGTQDVHMTIDASTWQHVVFTAERAPDYTQLHLRLYLNGALISFRDLKGWYPNRAFGVDDYTRYLVMGRNYVQADGGGDQVPRHFRGQLDDVRLYEGALTEAQVASLYASY